MEEEFEMNQVALIGRIVRKIEPKYSGENRMAISNVLAVNRTYKSGKKVETDFIPFSAWGKTAELLNEYCEKGDLVGLTGAMYSRSYLNNEKETVFVIELSVNHIQFLQQKDEKIS